MMASLHSQRVMEIMANATNVIAEGEVLQLMNAHDPETSEQRYLDVIHRKTARLFEAGRRSPLFCRKALPTCRLRSPVTGGISARLTS